MRDYLCVCVKDGRQFMFDVPATSPDEAFMLAESSGYECYSVSEAE